MHNRELTRCYMPQQITERSLPPQNSETSRPTSLSLTVRRTAMHNSCFHFVILHLASKSAMRCAKRFLFSYTQYMRICQFYLCSEKFYTFPRSSYISIRYSFIEQLCFLRLTSRIFLSPKR